MQKLCLKGAWVRLTKFWPPFLFNLYLANLLRLSLQLNCYLFGVWISDYRKGTVCQKGELNLGREVYRLEAKLADSSVISSYVKDWERAVEVLDEIKQQGYSHFFDYLLLNEVTLHQGEGDNDWLELERWRRPQPETKYPKTSPKPLALVKRPPSWFLKNLKKNPGTSFQMLNRGES